MDAFSAAPFAGVGFAGVPGGITGGGGPVDELFRDVGGSHVRVVRHGPGDEDGGFFGEDHVWGLTGVGFVLPRLATTAAACDINKTIN